MCKIDFYLLPANYYKNITLDDILILTEILDAIKLKDKFMVPDDFYREADKQNVTAYDYLYGNRQNDISRYLMELISKQSSSDYTYDLISSINYIGYVAFASEIIEPEKEKICAYNSKSDITKVKRFYIMQAMSYEEYCKWIEDCFPNLVFHKNAFDAIQKLGKFKDVKEELHRHLIVLCDNAKGIYYKCGKSEKDTYLVLKSKYGILCSGKGSNEEKEFKADYNGIKITCNPHTKLFTEHSDQRIYFCWGRDDIDNHNIIVARIGNHWN